MGMEMEMEMVEGLHFHSRTTGIEGILVFFSFLFTFISSSFFLSGSCFPIPCPARMMHLIRSLDFVMWKAEEGKGVSTTRGR